MLHQIEVFLDETKMAPSRFGRNVAKDPRLVFDLRNGRTPEPKMVKKISDYISSYNG